MKRAVEFFNIHTSTLAHANPKLLQSTPVQCPSGCKEYLPDRCAEICCEDMCRDCRECDPGECDIAPCDETSQDV